MGVSVHVLKFGIFEILTERNLVRRIWERCVCQECDDCVFDER